MNGNNENTDQYFKSYEDYDIHQLMLSDKPRINAYKNSIYNAKDKFASKVVMDVGAGTGILSILCAQAGAKKVYAVEASNLSKLILQVAEENNVKDKIEVVEKKIEDLDPDSIEKVDIIVSEWMGFYLLHEGMLDSVIIARNNFLKPNGLMFPSIAKIYAAPCELPNYFEFWNNIHGVSMKCIGENYRSTKTLKPEILIIPKEHILSDSKLLVWLDLKTVTLDELDSLGGEETVLSCCRNGKYEGLCIWFEVEFPDGTSLSTATNADPTHWKQTVIVLPQSIDVNEKEPIAFELKLNRNDSNPRRYNVTFIMLDASEVEHDIPCDCYFTKCIVTKKYIDSKSGNT